MSKSTPTPNKILTRCPVILVLLSYLDLVRSPSLLLGKLRGITLSTTNMASSMRANACWSRQCNSTRFTSFLEKYHPSPLMQPEELENEGFTLKTYQMFSVHTAQEEFINATTRRLLWVWIWNKLGRRNRIICYFSSILWTLHKALWSHRKIHSIHFIEHECNSGQYSKKIIIFNENSNITVEWFTKESSKKLLR